MNYNDAMKQLAEYIRLADETAEIIEGLKDKLKTFMQDEGVTVLNGDEHKATYKEVTGSRIDTAALKKELPDVAARYTRATASMRFTFA